MSKLQSRHHTSRRRDRNRCRQSATLDREIRPPSSSTSQGKTTAAEAARQHALTSSPRSSRKEDFITQGTEALRSHPRDLAQQFEAREKTLLAKVGELTLHVDV
ncbi:MAG: hypothetical protein HS117_17480 [Verrucomicrobiaceae bacterium]|nr:hypothetical protein [Verrucomicrobiaceae bacterium]